MLATYNRPQTARQHKSLIPMPAHDAPHPDELRARRVLSRVGISRELARELAGLAFGIPEKAERRAW